MNTVAKAANGLWSVVCMLVVAMLTGLFLYWMFLQQPFLTISDPGPREYVVTAGSILYIENPVLPEEFVTRLSYNGMLVKDKFTRYALPSPDVARQQSQDTIETIVPSGRAPASLYAVFIPSYVQPGDYTYEVVATYRLNPLRTATLHLPPVRIRVE